MMSSMHTKALTITLLLGSAVAVGATIAPSVATKVIPLAVQAAPAAQPPYQPAMRQAFPPPPSPRVSSAVAQWKSLRQTDSLPFSSYASFLRNHRGWPGETGLRNTAERAINPDSTSPSEIVAYFRAMPALTATGHARHAFALLALGQMEEARQAARQAWYAGVLPRTDEDRLLSLFRSAFTPQDHDRRMETLLANGDTTSARSTLFLTSPARRAVYDARLALQANAPDAASRVGMIGSAITSDPGVLMDRANWLRDTGQSAAARSSLAQRRTLSARPHDPEKWYETLLVMARGAANDRNWMTVYQIASQIDDAFPAGTDVSTRTAGERDNYTSLAWLAGSVALHELRRPADAIGMFERYARAARSAQTRSKGLYWAGRAASAAGQAERATAYFTEAAHPDLFYGQLALERLGRGPQPPVQAGPPVGPAERTAFARRDLVEATRLLGQMGQREDQSLFVRTLSEQVVTDQDRTLAGELGRQIGRPDLGVWVARSARNAGDPFYTQAGYPQVRIPPAQSRYWALSHAIIRQESSFDRTAVSPVGARGMMQLMPPTAREVTGKMGLPYDLGRLTRDPDYNITLGSAYFATLMDYWGGSAPLAVASYNAGIGNVRKWITANGDPRLAGADVLKWIEDIPYYETKNYVQRVLENAVVYEHLDPGARNAMRQNRLSYYLGKSSRPG